MADMSLGNLRFDLTADNSAFNDAIKKAEQTHRAAAQEMGKQMEDAAKKAEAAQQGMWDKLGTKTYEAIRKMQDFGKSFEEAFKGGADAAEKWTTDTFNSMKEKAETGLAGWVAKIPGGIGKFINATFDLLKHSGAIDTVMDWGGRQVAGWLDKWVEKFQSAGITDKVKTGLMATVAVSSTLLGGLFDQGTLDESQKRVETWADSIKKKMDEMVEGVRTALQKLAGTFDGISDEVKKALEELKKRTADTEFRNGLIGLDPGARARAAAERQFDATSGKALADYNEKELAARKAELDRHEAAAQAGADRQKLLDDTQRYEQAVQSVTAALKRQGEMALANAGAGYGKSARDRALERGSALADAYGRGRNAGISSDPGVMAANVASADQQQQAANIKFNYDLAEAIRFQSAAYDVQTASLGASAGESTRLKFTQDELNKAYREGVPITDSLRASIDASATALGRASQAAADAKERFEAFKQVGQTVASSLESAFDKWISGTRTNFSELIRGMAQDLAKLSFKRGIEGLLTGTSATGGGLFGMLANAFGGFRANGGDVNSSNAYIVGERGPELFVPRGSGSIVSNQALQGSGSVPQVINMKIDLTGANGDDTIARISTAAARQAFAQAVAQANAMAPGRQRSFQMLGA